MQAFKSGRPLSDAAQSLSQKYGYLISYEDPRRTCACDMVDESGQEMKTGDYMAPERRIVPRSRQLRVEYRAGGGAGDIARAIVSAAQTDLPEYRFRVVESGRWAHIVAVGSRDSTGKFATHRAPLDVRISLPAQSRASWMLIQAICDAISKQAGVKVHDTTMFGGIQGPEGPPQYTIGADNEVARDVLRRAVDAIFKDEDGHVIWVMNYDTSGDQFFLTLMSVPKTAN